MGRGGLQRTDVEGEAEVEIGWAIAPARWRQGLATELARTSIELGFGTLELGRLVAFTLPHNIASRRVMEKAGLAYEREIVHAGMPHVLYALNKHNEEQPAQHPGPPGAVLDWPAQTKAP